MLLSRAATIFLFIVILKLTCVLGNVERKDEYLTKKDVEKLVDDKVDEIKRDYKNQTSDTIDDLIAKYLTKDNLEKQFYKATGMSISAAILWTLTLIFLSILILSAVVTLIGLAIFNRFLKRKYVWVERDQQQHANEN